MYALERTIISQEAARCLRHLAGQLLGYQQLAELLAEKPTEVRMDLKAKLTRAASAAYFGPEALSLEKIAAALRLDNRLFMVEFDTAPDARKLRYGPARVLTGVWPLRQSELDRVLVADIERDWDSFVDESFVRLPADAYPLAACDNRDEEDQPIWVGINFLLSIPYICGAAAEMGDWYACDALASHIRRYTGPLDLDDSGQRGRLPRLYTTAEIGSPTWKLARRIGMKPEAIMDNEWQKFTLDLNQYVSSKVDSLVDRRVRKFVEMINTADHLTMF